MKKSVLSRQHPSNGGWVIVGAGSLWPGVTILPSEAMHPARQHWAAKLWGHYNQILRAVSLTCPVLIEHPYAS
jgi:hypothetical protein